MPLQNLLDNELSLFQAKILSLPLGREFINDNVQFCVAPKGSSYTLHSVVHIYLEMRPCVKWLLTRG